MDKGGITQSEHIYIYTANSLLSTHRCVQTFPRFSFQSEQKQNGEREREREEKKEKKIENCPDFASLSVYLGSTSSAVDFRHGYDL